MNGIVDHGWKLYQVRILTITPVNDWKEHDIGNPKCACNPFWVEVDTLVHNAFDGRVAYEQGRKFT